MRRFNILLAAVAIACALSLCAGVALAAPGLAGVQAEVDVAGEDATVRMNYSVVIDKAGVKAVPLTGLKFAGTTVVKARARSAGSDLAVTVKEEGLKLAAEVAVPADFKVGDKLNFTLEYEVKGAMKASGKNAVIHVPMLAVAWAPVAAVPGTFRVTALMPKGYSYVEGFPTEPSSLESSGDRVAVSYSMQVMPSMIRAVVTQGAPPFFNAERTLDFVAVALLLVVAYLAYYLIIRAPGRQEGAA